VRRFGYRLDSVQEWQAVNWNRFYVEASTMKKVEKTTRDLISLLEAFAKGDMSCRAYETPEIRFALQFAKDIRRNEGARDAAIRNLTTATRSACEADLSQAEKQLTYDFFRRQVAEEKRRRDDIARAFELVLKRGQLDPSTIRP